ncbi:uncharacterized protein K460DRAFT_312336 [Cucurbitaria berberidis CBS 394.84]|uniref:Zn(2)-C6 fungal-type domain-containing protein n=1 Tax=Cucurbitaria berberidis CBS 394.84 TaxID=1168544 RepID=A0A9P4GHF3_9PLEO|nr:uncharacterized protein K460DRAFT_312336 [Cucurbitaria berberidis CBS 394.84]KAF1845687.1 hypothetical protein K460DRAFT_312336 [Cucurbitaria berberidis CBS 394.84]
MVFRGKPSKACLRCRQRRLRCDQQRPSCRSCIRAGEPCDGYRDTESVRINDETELVRSKALSNAGLTQSKQLNVPIKFRHLPQDLQALGRDIFFAYYVSDFSRTWSFLFQYLDQNVTPEHVSLGIDAVSLAFLSHQVSSPTAKDLARRKYCLALGKINKELQDPAKARATTTFDGALLLDLFEKIMKSASEVNTSRHAHVEGALALVKLRGVEQFTESSELRALMGLSLNATICALSTGRPIPEEIRKIRRHAAQFLDTTYPKWTLSGVMLDVADLAAEMRRGTLTPEERVARSLDKDQELQTVALEAAPAWTYDRKFVSGHDSRVVALDGFFDVYPNRMITQMWNVLRLTRILLGEEIVESCMKSQDQESEAQSNRAKVTIIEMTREICASVPQMTNCDFAARHKLPGGGLSSPSSQHTHTMTHILDVYILIFSLYVVAWSRNCLPTTREWTVKQLQHIADHFGIKEAGIILDILKKQQQEERKDPCDRSSRLAHYRLFTHAEDAMSSPVGTCPWALKIRNAEKEAHPCTHPAHVTTDTPNRPLGPQDPRLCYRSAGFAAGPWTSLDDPAWPTALFQDKFATKLSHVGG